MSGTPLKLASALRGVTFCSIESILNHVGGEENRQKINDIHLTILHKFQSI